jgi:hypothetical protein
MTTRNLSSFQYRSRPEERQVNYLPVNNRISAEKGRQIRLNNQQLMNKIKPDPPLSINRIYDHILQ